MAKACIKKGDHVVHVGARVGYYSAILAELAGPRGRVTAFEINPTLAARAQQNLAGRGNVSAVCQDATTGNFVEADVIYANAGFTHFPSAFLENLRVQLADAVQRLPRQPRVSRCVDFVEARERSSWTDQSRSRPRS